MALHTLVTRITVNEEVLTDLFIRRHLVPSRLTRAAQTAQARKVGARWPVVWTELRDEAPSPEAYMRGQRVFAIKARVWRPRYKLQVLRWHGPPPQQGRT